MDVLYAVNVYKASCDGFNFFPSETKLPNGGGVYDGDHPNASDLRSLSGTWQSFHPLKNVMNMGLVER